MGFRFRKSIKIAPGVRLSVSKKSVGISAGVKGARISTNTRTGTRATIGIPGTGLSYSEKIGGKPRTRVIQSSSTDEIVFRGYVIDCGQCKTQQELPEFSDPSTIFRCISCNCTFALSGDLQAQLLGHSSPSTQTIPIPRPIAPMPPRKVKTAGECLSCNKFNLPGIKNCVKCGAKLRPVGAVKGTLPNWVVAVFVVVFFAFLVLMWHAIAP